MIKKIEAFIDNVLDNRDAGFISVLLVIFGLLRLPSTIEPYWYGDEGIYEVIGSALRSGRILYSQIWDNKPPILYLIYALFNGDQFYVRVASLVVGALSVIVFIFIARRLFTKRLPAYVATAIFAIGFALPVMEGNIANAENFMMLPTLAAFYLLFCENSKKKILFTVLAGLLLSISFLTKIVAVFDLAAFALAIFVLRFYDEISFERRRIAAELKRVVTGIEQEAVLLIAFLSPILITIVYFIATNSMADYVRAAFSQNVGYVAYGNFFIIKNGLLYLKLFVLLAITLIASRYRRSIGVTGFILTIWLSFAVFDALFSARPYTHYILVALAPLSLFIGYVMDNKKAIRFSLPFLLIAVFILLSTFKLNFRKVGPYYLNYFSYITGQKSSDNYRAFFDDKTPRDYMLADFIKTKTKEAETVFVWGDSAQIYKLSNKLPPGRYTVSYHISFYPDAVEETKRAFEKVKPKYIIQIKEMGLLENFLVGYQARFKLGNTIIYERES